MSSAGVDNDARSAGVACPVCGSVDVEQRARPRYRRPTRVAGVPIRLDDLDQRHYRCRQCTFQFVWPQIPEERLIDCYTKASASNWSTDPSVARVRGYAARRRLLEQFAPGRRVLDFGCFDGGFLEYLGSDWETFGIEPSTAAADRARARGVRVLAPTVDAVGAEYAGSFHAIVIFDVMEHLTDPVGVLRSLAHLLAPGGVMLIETGNTDATPWRVCGTDFWYCGLVEHVGFFNRQSIATAGERAAGMALVHFERTKHGYGVALRMRAMAPLRTAGYYGIRALHAAGVPLGERMGTVASGTAPRTWGMRDHFLALLRKPRDDDQRPAATGETRT